MAFIAIITLLTAFLQLAIANPVGQPVEGSNLISKRQRMAPWGWFPYDDTVFHAAPYCDEYTIGVGSSGLCSVTVRQAGVDWANAELYIYDKNCTQIGFNPSVPFGTEGFSLNSQLPYAIVIQNITRGPLTFSYGKHDYNPGNNFFQVFDTGAIDSVPACWNQFRCSDSNTPV